MHYNLLNRKGRVQWTSMKLIENSPGKMSQKKRLVKRFVSLRGLPSWSRYHAADKNAIKQSKCKQSNASSQCKQSMQVVNASSQMQSAVNAVNQQSMQSAVKAAVNTCSHCSSLLQAVTASSQCKQSNAIKQSKMQIKLLRKIFAVDQISSLRIHNCSFFHGQKWHEKTCHRLKLKTWCEKPRKYQYFCFGLVRKVTGNERSLTQKFESIPKKRLFLNNNRWSSRLIPTKISTNRPNKKYSNSDWEKFWNIF